MGIIFFLEEVMEILIRMHVDQMMKSVAYKLNNIEMIISQLS